MPHTANAIFAPGMLVEHPGQADWGTGQIQSVDGRRITVNFEHAGKRVINSEEVELVLIDPDPPRPS